MPDFKEAAKRHWDDAEYLFVGARLPNADQLYGIAAECALKAIMFGLGMKVDQSSGRPMEKKHAQHINKLWSEYGVFVSGRQRAKYWAPLSAFPAPFKGWSIYDRYEASSKTKQANVIQHQTATGKVLMVLDMAVIDGVVR